MTEPAEPAVIVDVRPSMGIDINPPVVENKPAEDAPASSATETEYSSFKLTTHGLRYQKTYYMPSDRVARFSKRWCTTEGGNKSQILEFLKGASEQVPSVYEEYKSIGAQQENVQADPAAKEKQKKEKQGEVLTKWFFNLVSVGLKIFGNANEPWCKTSSSNNQSYPWYSTEQSFTPPDITLDRSTKSIVDAYSSFGTNYTYVFADKFSSLMRGIEGQLPEEVEARIRSQWYINGGQKWPEDKNKKFEAMVKDCKGGFKIRYDHVKDLYEYTPGPDQICLSAMKLAVGENKVETEQPYNPYATQPPPKLGPVEELEKLIKNDYFLGFEWPDLVQLKTFVDPINEQSWALRLASRIVLAPAKYYLSTVAGLSAIGSVIARVALTDVGILVVTKFFANPLNLKYLFPWNWKKVTDFFKKHGKPKGPSSPAGGAPAADSAAKPAEDTAKAKGADTPKMVESKWVPVAIETGLFYFLVRSLTTKANPATVAIGILPGLGDMYEGFEMDNRCGDPKEESNECERWRFEKRIETFKDKIL